MAGGARADAHGEWPQSYARLIVPASLLSVAFLQVISILIASGSEQISRFMLLAVGAGLACRLTATVVDAELERACLKAFLDALHDADIPQKEAAELMGMPRSQFSEMVNGVRHTPSHSRMLNLPWPFWQAYLPKLAHVLVHFKLADRADDARARRLA